MATSRRTSYSAAAYEEQLRLQTLKEAQLLETVKQQRQLDAQTVLDQRQRADPALPSPSHALSPGSTPPPARRRSTNPFDWEPASSGIPDAITGERPRLEAGVSLLETPPRPSTVEVHDKDPLPQDSDAQSTDHVTVSPEPLTTFATTFRGSQSQACREFVCGACGVVNLLAQGFAYAMCGHCRQLCQVLDPAIHAQALRPPNTAGPAEGQNEGPDAGVASPTEGTASGDAAAVDRTQDGTSEQDRMRMKATIQQRWRSAVSRTAQAARGATARAAKAVHAGKGAGPGRQRAASLTAGGSVRAAHGLPYRQGEDMCGWLEKKGGSRGSFSGSEDSLPFQTLRTGSGRTNWKQRFFVGSRQGRRLEYYRDATQAEQLGTLDLSQCAVRSETHHSRPHCFAVHSVGRGKLVMSADTIQEAECWIAFLQGISDINKYT